MNKNRLEAFSDGVIAIIITIMVFNFKPPQGNDWLALRTMVPSFLTYILSFLFLSIYWNNHHHMLHTVSHINGKILWANLHLLFWLSMVPFATGWMGESRFAPAPVAFYGIMLLGAAGAYTLLEGVIIATHGHNSLLAAAVGKSLKEKLSLTLYASGILSAAWHPMASVAFYTVVALMWMVPDKRIEKKL